MKTTLISGKNTALAIAFFAIMAVTTRANAANISFSPLGTDRGYRVDVLLSTANGENINAVEGALSIQGASTDLAIEDGNSIVSLWTERPNISVNNGISRINFSGIIPGGFEGVLSPSYSGLRPGLLFSIFIPQEETGVLRIETASGKVYLDDGQGTALEMPAARIRFSPASGTGSSITTRDIIPPEPFTLELGRSSIIYNNKWLVAFRASDTGSGIDHYEIRELRNEAGPWKIVESPALLEDQSLGSTIEVKAVDRAGNIRIAELDPTYKPSPIKGVVYTVITVLILAAIAIYLFRRKRRMLPLL